MDNHPELSPSDSDSDYEDLLERRRRRGGCCFGFPCFGSGRSNSVWERVASTPEPHMRKEEEGATNTWSWEYRWNRGFNAFIKVREWSELVAGPKWKTFIRRYNKASRGGGGGGGPGGKFQYDPSSYALNFDDGQDDDDDRSFPDFSSRYASIPFAEAKSFVEVPGDRESNLVRVE